MADLLERASRLIQSEGFTGAHSLLFLIRYAALTGNRQLMRLVGSTLEELSTLPESAMLAYVYAEYYEAEKEAFCPAAAGFILDRCSGEDEMLLPALAKCARVFRVEKYLDGALDLAEIGRDDAFAALGMLEVYRATREGEYLNRAAEYATVIRNNFDRFFDAKAAYDIENPSANSALALVYDALARITQDEQWVEARKVHNRLISLLADRYPTRVAFGLCALLGDYFETKTVVCAVPEGELPPPVRTLLSFYEPLTEILVIPAKTDTAKYYLMKQGKLEELKGI